MVGLRPVPDTAPRALGMIRVSKERDGMMSPDVQRAAITDYCRTRGYEIVDWLEGIDQSGSRAKSAWWPRLTEAVNRVESGDIDVIVVWKFSRTARHRLRWAVALDTVDTAGGSIESATEQVDTSTSMGKFTRGMMGELNAFEAERIGEGWKEVHASRLAEGRAPQGTGKYGYVWNRETKLHDPDPVTGSILATAYDRYLSGESFYALVRWLNSAGHKTRDGGMWSDISLRRVLDSGFAAGLIPWKGEKYPGIHKPLIDEDTWQAYLDARKRRGAAPSRRERSQYVLSGLLRCARCKGPMVAGQAGAGGKPKYRCSTAKSKGPEVCPGGYVMAAYAEVAVLEWLHGVAHEVEVVGDALAGTSAMRLTGEGERRRLSREVVRLDGALARLTVQLAEGLFSDAEYRDARALLIADRDNKAARLEQLAVEERRAVHDPSAAAQGLLEAWEEWPVAQRRERLGELMQPVLVMTGRPHATFGIKGVWET